MPQTLEKPKAIVTDAEPPTPGPQAEPVIYELGAPGRRGYSLPPLDVPVEAETSALLPGVPRRDELLLPEVNELEVVRHFVRLSQRNYAIDVGFYPLGSCTMKYNPKINEEVVRLPGWQELHPLQSDEECQGALALLYRLERLLCEIGGMDRATLQPAAGAQGEMTGLLIARAYFRHRGEIGREVVIVPDSSHGTNPATASRCGFRTVSIASNARGRVDLNILKRVVNEHTAVLMLTNPNTLGLFEEEITEIARVVHQAGGLVYCDGANMNAILGRARPGDMGFDLMHFNLHKTFSTPHGGGGPGAGPVAVKAFLADYLPIPVVERVGEKYRRRYRLPLSIGKVHSFSGNFGILARAYAYIRSNGAEGLREISDVAVLNANYLASLLADRFRFDYGTRCMHEFVLSARLQRERGVSALDIGKRLMDYRFYPPTVYFPLIVKEAMMIEPTETETPETLERFAAAMNQIDQHSIDDPEIVRGAPHFTPVGRLDETAAARRPDLVWGRDEG